jgi:hypothetical protein
MVPSNLRLTVLELAFSRQVKSLLSPDPLFLALVISWSTGVLVE